MSALRELFASFAFDFDNTKLREADKSVDSLSGKITALAETVTGGSEAMIGAFQGVAAALAGGFLANSINQFANELDTFDDLSAQTGILTDQLQLLGYAAKVNGSSQEEMFASLNRLQMAMGRTAEAGGPVAEVLKKMGVDTGNAADGPRRLNEALPEILAGFGNLESEAEQAQAAMTLFGRSGVRLLPILRHGEEGMAALHEEFERFGGPVSAETIAAAGEYRDMIVRLDTAFFKLKGELASAVFPQLSKVVEMSAQGVAAISQWAKSTTLAETATVAFAASIGSALWPALAPFLKGGLKFGAIFLAVDDLIAFLRGHDSLIGRLLDGAFGDGSADAVRDWANDAIDWLTVFRDSAIETFKAVEEAELFSLRGMAAAIVGFFRDASNGFPVFEAAMQRSIARAGLEFQRFVLGLIESWNKFVATLGGNGLLKGLTDALQLDPTSAFERVQAAENEVIRYVEKQESAELGTPAGPLDPATAAAAYEQQAGRVPAPGGRVGRTVDRFDPADPLPYTPPAQVTLPERAFSPAITTIPGPFAPGQAPNFSMVQTAPITINVPAGTTQQQAEAIARAAQRGVREANREARQALVPRK